MPQPSAPAIEPQPVPHSAPNSLAEVGINKIPLQDLALKTAYVTAPPSLLELSLTMRLPYWIVDQLFRHLRCEQLMEVTGMRGNAPMLGLTSQGRARAVELLAANQYTGPAPVSLADYTRQVRQQSSRDPDIHPADISRAFAHMVLEETILTRLGTALHSGAPLFLYGPAGTGKTEIALGIGRAFPNDRVLLPFAVEADGQIITVYDPHVHAKADEQVADDTDMRWVLCRRPSVLVGGELTIEMLDLQLDPISKSYSAPVQMKANNGVLIIDDFGRQRLQPEELLNRWIIPLDRRIDFLSLAGGRKIEVPFEILVVFATNLEPSRLADAAFLRRIRNKIKLGPASPQQFHEIFNRVCRGNGLACEDTVVKEIIDTIQNKRHEILRPCYPRDIINQVRWAAAYEKREPRLDRQAVLAAIDAYFVSEADAAKGN